MFFANSVESLINVKLFFFEFFKCNLSSAFSHGTGKNCKKFYNGKAHLRIPTMGKLYLDVRVMTSLRLMLSFTSLKCRI